MLDAQTKSKTDSARDILVGKVPDPKSQVEQITIALIYKFMDDMDRQSEELGGKATFFTGDFKKYRWANLLDKRLGGHERLGDAFEYLLSVLGTQGDAGQFRTPRHIIDFIVAVVD